MNYVGDRDVGGRSFTGRALAEGPSVMLWPLENQHIDSIQALISDPEVRETWRTRGAYWAPYQLQAYLARDVLTSAVVTSRVPEHEVIGLVELLDPDFVDRRAHLSLVAARPYLNTGMAIEAAMVFLDLAFRTYPLDKICLEVQSRNRRLVPGLRRLLHHEGTLERHINVRGEWLDLELFALWRADMPKLRERFKLTEEVPLHE